MYAQIFWIGANVMGANISWARTFHGCKHFMGANISWARIFHGREYFMGANISWARTFMHVVCANIFGANVLKPRFKIDVFIMIICSIVIIINSVLTQVSTAKYPMIADLAK